MPPLAALLILLSFPVLVHAQGTVNWDGSSSGSWGTAANWIDNEVPESGDLLVFPSAASSKDMFNDLPSGVQYESLNFSAPGYSVTGGRMNFFVSGTGFPTLQAGHASGTTMFNCPFDQSDTTASFRSLPGGTLAFGPNASGNLGTGILRLESSGTIIVGGTFSGNGTINIVFGGVTRFEANQSHTGTTSVAAASTLYLNATMSGSLFVSGTLRGTGRTISGVTLNGDIDPGDTGPGRLTIDGSIVFSTGNGTADAFFDLAGPAAGTEYDQIRVGGSVQTNGTHVTLRAPAAFPLGTTFILIDKTGSGSISRAEPFVTPDGTPITEGFEHTVGVNRYRFSYVGGTGNDFTATTVEIKPEVFTPVLRDITVVPAGPPGSGRVATLSGIVSGGPAEGHVVIEASDDLVSWRPLATLPLDQTGAAAFDVIPDPASEGAAALSFRGRLAEVPLVIKQLSRLEEAP